MHSCSQLVGKWSALFHGTPVAWLEFVWFRFGSSHSLGFGQPMCFSLLSEQQNTYYMLSTMIGWNLPKKLLVIWNDILILGLDMSLLPIFHWANKAYALKQLLQGRTVVFSQRRVFICWTIAQHTTSVISFILCFWVFN
jgi:hypothetical protein